MKLWLLSDLHTEFHPFSLPSPLPLADVCVVAGDVVTKGPTRAVRLLSDAIGGAMPVVMVAGNHDHYGASLSEGLAEARHAVEGTNVHFLENDAVHIKGVLFVGATLWTDQNLSSTQDLSVFEAGRQMNDYKRIKWSKRPFRKLSPFHTVRSHLQSVGYLDRTLEARGPMKAVVVTHHAPSPLSLDTAMLSNEMAPSYASDLSGLIERRRPTLWVHGHVHSARDYFVGNTRIVCNPRGYPEESTGFNPRLVVTV